MEKIMDGPGRFATQTKSRAVLVGTGPQMGDSAQKFVGMTFFLKREALGIGRAENANLGGAQFPCLPLTRRGHQLAGDGEGSTGGSIA